MLMSYLVFLATLARGDVTETLKISCRRTFIPEHVKNIIVLNEATYICMIRVLKKTQMYFANVSGTIRRDFILFSYIFSIISISLSREDLLLSMNTGS